MIRFNHGVLGIEQRAQAILLNPFISNHTTRLNLQLIQICNSFEAVINSKQQSIKLAIISRMPADNPQD